MLPEPVASILRSGREQYNARFAAARHRWPELDAASFKLFFGSFVAPQVAIAEAVRPGSAVAMTEAAYDVALELVGQRLAGTAPRHGAIHALWAQGIGPLIALIAAAPARLLPALNNAAHHLATTPGTRADDWIAQLAELGARAKSADELLAVGQVLAWRAGLAHFRRGALAAADALPEPLAVAAIGAPAGTRLADLRTRLADDPWFDPRAGGAAKGQPRPKLAGTAGAFRGFDGLFLEPPRVAIVQDRWLVRSGDDAWVLEADVFGATFHRATPAETGDAKIDPWARPSPVPAEIARLPEVVSLGEITSHAQLGCTLALTGTLSHRVVLCAL